MKMIDSFVNQYPVSKTLRFKLLPYGDTLINFTARDILSRDMELAEDYKTVKKYMDDYHKQFIDAALSTVSHLDVSFYAQLYCKLNKSDKERKALESEAEKLRKIVARTMTSHPLYKKLFGKEMITELLPEYLEEEQRKTVEKFNRFTTYFIGFYENRKNMYTDEAKATGIANRCINENLPRYLDNMVNYGKIASSLGAELISALDADSLGLTGHTLGELFSSENYASVLTEQGISRYNNVIGGYTFDDGSKVQGLNEHINKFNQTHGKSERLPKMKMLYRQILSDNNSISFIPEKFESDDELLLAVARFADDVLSPAVLKISTLFSELEIYRQDGIFLENSQAMTALSNKLCGSWHGVKDAWSRQYDREYTGKKKSPERYEEEKEKAWKGIKALSFECMQSMLPVSEGAVCGYFKNAVESQTRNIKDSYENCRKLLREKYSDKPKRLAKNDEDIALLKNYLDSAKELERLLKPLISAASEDGADSVFYGELDGSLGFFRELDILYDKVRNHITQKPYSTDKIKLTFENPQLLAGWDRNKERDYRTVLLRRKGEYYLGIMEKNSNNLFSIYPSEADEGWEKIDYKLLPGPNKMLPKVFFSKSKIDFFAPSAEVLGIYERESFKKGPDFSQSDCHKLIAFYQRAIARHPEWSEYDFVFKKPEEYADIAQFYRDVEKQGYKLGFRPISAAYIEDAVREGRLYLFKIYNKDFSPSSKGTPNLHTLYFRMLFDDSNLRDVVYQLNGGAEMFYRLPSIKEDERVIHYANQPIDNKKPHSEKSRSIFAYDLIKDKRYTQPQFNLHIPIKMNFKAEGTERLNVPVRKALKDKEKHYVIGIDRGERHLVYITVVDSDGKIVEQYSGNCIENSYAGKTHITDYHALLAKKENERLAARQNWSTIENIKELKEGYISQIVHKICELVVKYDAIIAMEDLNSGFKNSRVKVEKQVYQKFEKMLIDKLNYMVDKHTAPEAAGGLLKAYQLTEKFESFSRMKIQNGIIFYVPPWLTSKIDPATGFVDLLKPRYINEEESRVFISKFESIRYNSAENLFEFSFDYRDFPGGTADSRGKWTVCSYGDRIETYRDEEQNGKFTNRKLDITQEWAALFREAGIEYQSGELKARILEQSGKAFFSRFMYLMRMTLQMRNSIINGEEDYLISPVRNNTGGFYDSRLHDGNSSMPDNADANGAYNIARKALWVISVLEGTPDEDLSKARLSISNKEWLAYAQSHE